MGGGVAKPHRGNVARHHRGVRFPFESTGLHGGVESIGEAICKQLGHRRIGDESTDRLDLDFNHFTMELAIARKRSLRAHRDLLLRIQRNRQERQRTSARYEFAKLRYKNPSRQIHCFKLTCLSIEQCCKILAMSTITHLGRVRLARRGRRAGYARGSRQMTSWPKTFHGNIQLEESSEADV